MSVTDLRDRIARHAFRSTTEDELQQALAQFFEGEGLAFEREAQLGPTDRPDFLFAGGVAVEVKIGGSLAALTRQVHRYLGHDRVASVLVVTTKLSLTRLPSAMQGKPVDAVRVGGHGGL